MEKFVQAACCVIIVLLAYIILRQEKFLSFTDTLRAKEYNFKNNARGYSAADEFLKAQLHA